MAVSVREDPTHCMSDSDMCGSRYVRVCIYACLHDVCLSVYMYVCRHVCMYIFSCIRVCRYVYV